SVVSDAAARHPREGDPVAGAAAARARSTACAPPSKGRRRVMSDKIKAQHVARKAILYVRQSSAHQVTHNLESQRLQYAMRDRLQQLGWREIDVVDEDLGRSAAGLVTRGIRTHGGGGVFGR